MAKYKLTNKAVEDLTEIWEHTFEFWSENQADKYYGELIFNCEEIARKPDLGKNYKGISKQLYGKIANRHIIFYRILDNNYVEIMRILHERMDLKERITDL